MSVFRAALARPLTDAAGHGVFGNLSKDGTHAVMYISRLGLLAYHEHQIAQSWRHPCSACLKFFRTGFHRKKPLFIGSWQCLQLSGSVFPSLERHFFRSQEFGRYGSSNMGFVSGNNRRVSFLFGFISKTSPHFQMKRFRTRSSSVGTSRMYFSTLLNQNAQGAFLHTFFFAWAGFVKGHDFLRHCDKGNQAATFNCFNCKCHSACKVDSHVSS